MNINILKENMLRFNTKNLKNSTTRNMIKESVQPRMEDMVTLNGKQHAVVASAWDESSIDPNDAFTASKIREAGAGANNWVLLQTSTYSYDSAYDDLAGDQLRAQWNDGKWMFVSADKLQPATNAAPTATQSTTRDGSWEEFLKAIADKINTDKNDPRTNLTSAEIDSAYEKMPEAEQSELWNDIWGEYKWSVGTNKPGGAENAVRIAIEDFFPKTK
jgi:hypothetical protein